jgi:hypothetical protein
MEKTAYVWKWRDAELSSKEFYKLNKEEKEEYLNLVKGLPVKERSTMDEFLVNLYNLDKNTSKNYFEL